jgi:hypothetical protein
LSLLSLLPLWLLPLLVLSPLPLLLLLLLLLLDDTVIRCGVCLAPLGPGPAWLVRLGCFAAFADPGGLVLLLFFGWSQR